MEHLAESLIATLRESLLVLDSEWRVQIANRSFYRTFQVEPEEVEGQCLYDLGNGRWDTSQLRAALQELAVHNTTLEELVIELPFTDSDPKVMMLNARRVQRKAGAAPLFLLVMDDITKQHQADAIIQQYLHQLEVSNRELEDFAFIASHDLQEPLRAIQAFSERLENKYAQSLDERGVDYLRRIQKAAGRMRQLISDLLTYSRVTTQGKPFEPVDLGHLVHECIADLSQRLEETGGSVEVGDLPSLDADPVQMRQLLQNLLDNGLKFHRPDQTPHVIIESRSEASPEFAAPPLHRADEEYCYLTVQDNGIGFDEKYRERIFSPFERLHSQKEYPGTGIGLAVCRRIVERHGGSLTTSSTPGQGTTFFIALPRYQPQELPPQEAPQQQGEE